MPILGFEIPADELKEKEKEYYEKYEEPKESYITPDVTTPLEIIPREAWGAAPPTSKEPLCTPLDTVLILDTGTEGCNDTDQCLAAVKELQTFYMEKKGLPDIPWNFLIGGDGKVYEGRGWVRKSSKLTPETEPLDGKSFDMAYIGDFRGVLPAMHESFAGIELLEMAERDGHITRHYKVESFLLKP